MIAEDTRIDLDRISDYDMPSVSAVLSDVYGSEFERASQKERLLFIEAIAFSLRVDCEFNESLSSIFGTHPNLPETIYTLAKVQRNEGLNLLAVLQVAIVEGYSVSAANERLAN